MYTEGKLKEYPPLEERINVISHAFGSLLSMVGLYLLVSHALHNGTTRHLISFSIFGACLIILYSVSALYHNAKHPRVRSRFRIMDHASIYVLIAGTYTPFTLITLQDSIGWILFLVVWGIAGVGIILKLFYTGKYNLLSTLMYIAMGWIVVFALKPLVANLHTNGLIWLFVGGGFYTLGAILYSIKRMPFNHATFHICVLGGSFCHYISVYYYVLPTQL